MTGGACQPRYPRPIGARDDNDERPAIVADELELVRVGLAAALAPLGVGIVAECASGRDAYEHAAFALPELVIVGAVRDTSTLAALTRLRTLDPAPRLIGLFAHAGDPDAGAAATLGVEGIALRASPVSVLADLAERVLKGEIAVADELSGALVGEVRLAAVSASDAVEPVGNLSAREREMLQFLADGRSNREIAATLSISLATVKTHLVRLYAKLGVSNRNEALNRAVSLRILR